MHVTSPATSTATSDEEIARKTSEKRELEDAHAMSARSRWSLVAGDRRALKGSAMVTATLRLSLWAAPGHALLLSSRSRAHPPTATPGNRDSNASRHLTVADTQHKQIYHMADASRLIKKMYLL
jgi:hypothetical protein